MLRCRRSYFDIVSKKNHPLLLNKNLRILKLPSLHVSLHPCTLFQTEGSWGRHLRWRCIGKATGLALPITHRRGRHTPTPPAPHTAWALCSKISGMISVKLGVYSHFPSWDFVQRRGWGSVHCFLIFFPPPLNIWLLTFKQWNKFFIWN